LRTVIAIALSLCLTVACARTEKANHVVPAEKADPSNEVFALGSAVTQTGAVTAESANEQFPRGQELYVSVDVTSSSTDQTIAVQWLDPQGKVMRVDKRQVPQTSAYATFSSGPTKTWKSGKHTAVIVIDGRKVSEKVFSII
jgi:hypothetical protein